ncbi:Ldh family oxidoreductase [Falsirhodobacter sp. 20TX0035]|uniref:Ldh family oxidoreductase n=1 Tax=Falsirhodobacter sp. 20TX0035 TaxID=3022019 RepID=UPI00232E3769|nr:Ldh family oxidoreductase [Falsirhodobacter sp. 20TX0035]MDB6454187.1 Ldh family oxidoreductase [Falsirhodobacter sp. 20TX0035]
MHPVSSLRLFAADLFLAAGLDAEKAEAVAHYLVEADMMGHSTHGLALAPWYLQSIDDGVMTKSGDHDVRSDRGAAILWNGRRLPGAWLVSRAVRVACDRARQHGTCTLTIADSHHIGALAAYLGEATDQGLMISIASSSPSGAQVAPFGGLKGVFTPNPVAYGIPTPGDPILIDISASITTVNMAQRMIREGHVYDHPWIMDAEGRTTTDPAVVTQGGTLLPTGGLDHGQKGYGMALSVEALTQGLAGYGRADDPKGTNCAVTITVHDPEAFGGREAFLRQTGWLVESCLASPPRDPGKPVRLPGQAALLRARRAATEGVALHPTIWPALVVEAQKCGVRVPTV